MRQTRELRDVHKEALDGFDAAWSQGEDERKQAISDRRFAMISGGQWEGRLGEQFENRPKFEVNKIQQALVRIFNEYRNNRIGVYFVPKDGVETDLQESAMDLFRADEQDSNAEEAYDNAFDEGTTGGMGAFRLRACYENEEDEEDDRQRIRIEPIFDADQTVFFDRGAKRQDKSDATRCWVLTSMTPEDYKAEYGEDPTSWPKPEDTREFDWCTPDLVYVAEYYVVETEPCTIVTLVNALGDEKKHDLDDEDEIKALKQMGYKEKSRRKIKERSVHKYILSGGGVLEDCGEIAGKHIPIVPYYGKRFYIDGIERFQGHVRNGKDPQRIKNVQLSKLVEIAAQSSVEKPILTPEQIAGHQIYWEDDPIKNYAYLLVNPITGPDGNPMPAGPLGYTKPPQVPPALAALVQVSETDLAEILGYNQQQDKMVSNISGKAVELIQQRVDMNAYIYMSNFGKALRRAAEIWLSMAKDIYTEKRRKLKGVNKDGKPTQIELMKPVMQDEKLVYANDLREARFDVTFDVGPASSSKKQSVVRALTGMMAITQDPTTQQVLTAGVMANLEGEGLEDINDYFRRKMVEQGVFKPTEEERAELQKAQEAASQQPPDANTQYLQAAAAKEDASAQKLRADTLKTLKDADRISAQTVEIFAGIDAQELDNALKIQASTTPQSGEQGQ